MPDVKNLKFNRMRASRCIEFGELDVGDSFRLVKDGTEYIKAKASYKINGDSDFYIGIDDSGNLLRTQPEMEVYRMYVKNPLSDITDGDVFLNGKEISLEQLKEAIDHRVDNYKDTIKEKIQDLEIWISFKKNEYEENHHSIEFAAYRMEQCIEDYKRYLSHKALLESGKIGYFEDETYDYVYVVEDIKPIKLDESDYE